jgi:predicted metal-binding membrane protein
MASAVPDDAERGPLAVALVTAAVVTAACWVATVRGGRAMAGSMPMPGGWAMSMAWMPMPGQTALGAALMFLGMWEVMMIAMMLPSAMPMVLLHRRVRLVRAPAGERVAPETVLLCGYFAVWLLFGVIAYLGGVVLATAAMRSPAVSRAVPAATGLALVVSGVWQCTPWKLRCLAHCRSPLSFVAQGWRPGWRGAFRLGLHHGAYCAACCWALMAMQLAVGVMNLAAMVGIALVIFVEKVWRRGDRLATAVGVVAIVAGAAQLVAILL